MMILQAALIFSLLTFGVRDNGPVPAARATSALLEHSLVSNGCLTPITFIEERQPFVPLPEPGRPPTTPFTGSGGSGTGQSDIASKPAQIGGAEPGETPTEYPPGKRDELVSRADRKSPSAGSSLGVWQIVKAGGVVGFVIIGLSILAGALVFDQLMTLRKETIMPPEVIDKISQHLAERDWKGVMETCQQSPCVFTSVIQAGLAEGDLGWHEVEKAMSDALTEQTARLLRRVEYLSVIGNLAPMLGLLGTVVGMILAFRTVAETQGAARAADLAQAIYLALITTVEGLLVAIPALAAYAFFRNRIDELMAEVATTAQGLLAPLRRRRSASRMTTESPLSPAPKTVQ